MVEVKAINPSQSEVDDSIKVASQSHHPTLYLQLGAFREFKHAEKLQSQVKTLTNKPVFIDKGTFHHLPIYRVQIGPLIGVGESDYLHNRLKKLGLGTPITVIGMKS